jgi:hypothetical protein
MNRTTVWIFRLSWALLALSVAPAIGEALAHRSRPVCLVGTIGAWTAWGVVLMVSLVPTTVSLTVLRCLAPASVVASAVAWGAGASDRAGALGVATAALASVVAFTGELGHGFVQGSAYGHERRYPLRPPGPVLVVLPLTWSVMCAAGLIGPLALAARNWIAGGLVTAAAGAAGFFLGRSYHRLSKRWLVLVPNGVVLHDYLELAETQLVPVSAMASAGLALVGSEAASLTGTALGPALELRFAEMQTLVLAAPPRGLTRAIHAHAVLISPTRPGVTLRALAAHGVAVG